MSIKAACLHPGVISSDLVRELISKDSFYYKYHSLISPIVNFFLKTPEEGAQTTLFCALAPDDVIQQGGYYFDCKLKEPSKSASNHSNVIQNWQNSQIELARIFGSE